MRPCCNRAVSRLLRFGLSWGSATRASGSVLAGPARQGAEALLRGEHPDWLQHGGPLSGE